MDLILNNLQRLICHKTQTNKQRHSVVIYISNDVSAEILDVTEVCIYFVEDLLIG